jgi:hypothetical protein
MDNFFYDLPGLDTLMFSFLSFGLLESWRINSVGYTSFTATKDVPREVLMNLRLFYSIDMV